MRIEGDHAIIETAEEAAAVNVQWNLGETTGTKTNRAWIEKDRILEAITPKEGDAVFWGDAIFWWDNSFDDNCAPGYWHNESIDLRGCVRVKANAITTGRTVGELRALLTWAKGEA